MNRKLSKFKKVFNPENIIGRIINSVVLGFALVLCYYQVFLSSIGITDITPSTGLCFKYTLFIALFLFLVITYLAHIKDIHNKLSDKIIISAFVIFFVATIGYAKYSAHETINNPGLVEEITFGGGQVIKGHIVFVDNLLIIMTGRTGKGTGQFTFIQYRDLESISSKIDTKS